MPIVSPGESRHKESEREAGREKVEAGSWKLESRLQNIPGQSQLRVRALFTFLERLFEGNADFSGMRTGSR